MKTVSTDSTSAVETPSVTGFLSDDPHYRLTGHFKDEKEPAAAKEEAPPASTEEKEPPEIEDASATSEASKAAASATAPTQREEKKENRWEKREREVRELREKVARLEAAKPPTQEVRSEPAQDSQPATETRAKAAKEPLIDDVDPKTGKAVYASWKEFQKDHDKWNRQEAIREFQEMSARSAQETATQRQFEERRGNLRKKFEAPRAKYADFDEVALNDIDMNDIDPRTGQPSGKLRFPGKPVMTIPAGSVAELFIHDSDHAGEVLYHLGKHPEILQGFYRNYDPKSGKFESLMSPQRQFRKLMEIEGEVSGAAKAPPAATSSTTSSSARPAAQASQASPPPHQVDGKGTVVKDTIEQAVADGDTETYMKAQNARELARLKRK